MMVYKRDAISINKAIHLLVCPLCGAILSSASEKMYLADYAWCNCDGKCPQVEPIKRDHKVVNKKYYTPVMWDDRTGMFEPISAEGDFPRFEKYVCEEICKQFNTVVSHANWKPQSGEVYYHPCTWTLERNFAPIDNSVAFDNPSYPCFKNEEECSVICEQLNTILLRFLKLRIK